MLTDLGTLWLFTAVWIDFGTVFFKQAPIPIVNEFSWSKDLRYCWRDERMVNLGMVVRFLRHHGTLQAQAGYKGASDNLYQRAADVLFTECTSFLIAAIICAMRP